MTLVVLVAVFLLFASFACGALAVLIWNNRKDVDNDTVGGGGGGGGVFLPVGDLNTAGGGAWRLKGRVDWRKSKIVTFQGGPAIRVFYGKGSGTSRHSGVGGIGFGSAPSGLPGVSALMSFQVYFEPGWDWSGGGKLTGFSIGTGDASGGNHSPTGASCRMSFKTGGGAWMYVYPPEGLAQEDPDLRKDAGTGIGLFRDNFPPGTLKVGQWNDVQIGVRVNTFDSNGKPNADGSSFLRVNDRSATLKNIRWSRSKDLVITSYNFTSFFGGSDPSKVDCAAVFRNFKLQPF